MKRLSRKNARFHKHDCKSCKFLGQYVVTEGNYKGNYDLYADEDIITWTVIARRSSEPSDYMSGIEFAIRNLNPVLVVAMERAIAMRYFTLKSIKDSLCM